MPTLDHIYDSTPNLREFQLDNWSNPIIFSPSKGHWPQLTEFKYTLLLSINIVRLSCKISGIQLGSLSDCEKLKNLELSSS